MKTSYIMFISKILTDLCFPKRKKNGEVVYSVLVV